MTYLLNDGQSTREFARLNDATKRADKLADQNPGQEFKVTHDETDAVVYATSHRAHLVLQNGEHFSPWTRIENPTFVAPDFVGFIPAYIRKRIEATVYRANEPERGGLTNWRVFDGRTGHFRDVANTKAACALTSAMRAGLML
jgi:hypothetical protein